MATKYTCYQCHNDVEHELLHTKNGYIMAYRCNNCGEKRPLSRFSSKKPTKTSEIGNDVFAISRAIELLRAFDKATARKANLGQLDAILEVLLTREDQGIEYIIE